MQPAHAQFLILGKLTFSSRISDNRSELLKIPIYGSPGRENHHLYEITEDH